MSESDGDVKFRDWAIALGATTAVFFITTLVLACILFVIVCRKISNLRKERDSRVTGVLQGVTSPHWINHTDLNDALAHGGMDTEKQPQNIWAISTQTFERNPTNQSTSPVGGSGNETFSRETSEARRRAATTPAAAVEQNVKPNRTAPPPPISPKKRKGKKGQSSALTPKDTSSDDREPVPYVYPLHKIKQPPATTSAGNQSHEYAQPNIVRDVTANGKVKKHEYRPIDPKLKQPDGQYQDLLVNGLARGQSLPTISTFTTLNS